MIPSSRAGTEVHLQSHALSLFLSAEDIEYNPRTFTFPSRKRRSEALAVTKHRVFNPQTSQPCDKSPRRAPLWTQPRLASRMSDTNIYWFFK